MLICGVLMVPNEIFLYAFPIQYTEQHRFLSMDSLACVHVHVLVHCTTHTERVPPCRSIFFDYIFVFRFYQYMQIQPGNIQHILDDLNMRIYVWSTAWKWYARHFPVDVDSKYQMNFNRNDATKCLYIHIRVMRMMWARFHALAHSLARIRNAQTKYKWH